jgi:hypothetical protein
MEYDRVLALVGPRHFLAELFASEMGNARQEKGIFSTISSDEKGGFEKKLWRLFHKDRCHWIYSGTKYLALRTRDGILILPCVLDIGRRPAKRELCFLDLDLFHPYPEEIATSGHTLPPLLGVFMGSNGVIWGYDADYRLYALQMESEGTLRVTPGPAFQGFWATTPIEIEDIDGNPHIIFPFKDRLVAWDPRTMKAKRPFDLKEYSAEHYDFVRGEGLTGKKESFFLMVRGGVLELVLLEKEMMTVVRARHDFGINGCTRPVVLQKNIWYVTGDGQVVGLLGDSDNCLSTFPTGCRVCIPDGLVVSEDRYLHIAEERGHILLFDTWEKKPAGIFNLFEKTGKSENAIRVKGIYHAGNTLFMNWLYPDARKETWGLSEVAYQGPRLTYKGIDHNIGRVIEML